MTKTTNNLVLILLIISTTMLGVSILLMGHHNHITLTTDFYGITQLLSGDIFNSIAGISFLFISAFALVSIFNAQLYRWLGLVIIAVSVIPLLSLLGHSMWIASLGGFPAIGAGQGVIKYFALLAVGIYFLKPQLSSNYHVWLNALPVVLVLLWIGGMKFTLLEAQGIEDLVKSSPLMSWMYDIWDLQTTSNIIGVYDLIALFLVIGSIFYRKLLVPAVIMSGAVFVVTQTFFFSWPAAMSSDTLLSTGGHFLIKDLWFIANLIIFTVLIAQQQKSN